MRGSPIIRFVLLAIGLLVTGWGLARITSTESTHDQNVPIIVPENSTTRTTPFHLLLSAPAEVVEIDTGRVIRPSIEQSSASGQLELDPKNPRIGLVVRWKNAVAGGEHRFAKLTLEIPGQETFTHVFDAAGDIDDFLELPLPAANHE